MVIDMSQGNSRGKKRAEGLAAGFINGRPPASWCVRVKYSCELDGTRLRLFGIWTYPGASSELWTKSFLPYDPERLQTALIACPKCGNEYQRSGENIRADMGPVETWDRRTVTKKLGPRGVS
jgi:hypothetical protein